jgi:hypothetical protein
MHKLDSPTAAPAKQRQLGFPPALQQHALMLMKNLRRDYGRADAQGRRVDQVFSETSRLAELSESRVASQIRETGPG